MYRYFERLWQFLGDSGRAGAVRDEMETRPRVLPVVWLLGKTGAGKSSLIRSLTGVSDIELGNGFAPCTRSAQTFDYPTHHAVVRFLDTRGLGEADYDPAEDLAQCEQGSHVVLAVARLDDPVQGELADALAAVHRRRAATPIVVVHNGADLVGGEQERFRARSRAQSLLESAAGTSLDWVETTLPPGEPAGGDDGVDGLLARLEVILPEVALLLAREDVRGDEKAKFAEHRAEVLWYASAAGTSDVAPVVGAVTVPSVQAAMLRMLGKRYQVRWTRARLGEFAVALGVGAASRYGASYVVRQAAKLIPVWGQSAGAAVAGTISFATTFALGRAAAYYLHRVAGGEDVPADELRRLYRDALKKARRERR